MTVITRFAPSPTGYLHIGGARTALFNFLYARHHGGQYLLRIEDTDHARSSKDAIKAIFDGLEWLGLAPDGPAVMQSARSDRHAEVALQMVERGAAFRCYMTDDETTAAREAAKAEGRALRSPWRDGGAAPDRPYTIRLRAPDRDMCIADAVQGDVRVAGKEIDDLVLLRADGTPTYMLAVVVDDHDMAITHVIRGDDHLTNAFRQTPIYQAMDWKVPAFAHIPLIHGPDGAKLSKRHGALAVQAYREMGYLPEGLKNYLLRLGWSHGDDEIISEAQAIGWFNLDAIGRGPSRMDFDKMAAVNSHYMKTADPTLLLGLLKQHLDATGEPLSPLASARVELAVPTLRERSATIVELAEQTGFLRDIRKIDIAPKAAEKLTNEAIERLARLNNCFMVLDQWEQAAIEHELARFCADEGIGIGKVGPALRAALTGGKPSPDIGLVLYWLGRQEVTGRIMDQVSR
jgi:glutamyl-tRNA synthetase